jgi:hypothetical protein
MRAGPPLRLDQAAQPPISTENSSRSKASTYIAAALDIVEAQQLMQGVAE